jgi:MerR family mercuric resistance operon transcriptional regulator
LHFRLVTVKLIPVVNYGINPLSTLAQKIPSEMKIGHLAEETGVHLETIRYYQRLGLVPKPEREYGSVRRYGEDAISRLRFIKRAQALGFSLDEVRLLLELSVGQHCAETRTLAGKKLQLVEKKISDLRRIRAALSKLVRACDTGRKGGGCPIIESFARDAATGRSSRERARQFLTHRRKKNRP